jgi:hypothetical protein
MPKLRTGGTADSRFNIGLLVLSLGRFRRLRPTQAGCRSPFNRDQLAIGAVMANAFASPPIDAARDKNFRCLFLVESILLVLKTMTAEQN